MPTWKERLSGTWQYEFESQIQKTETLQTLVEVFVAPFWREGPARCLGQSDQRREHDGEM